MGGERFIVRTRQHGGEVRTRGVSLYENDVEMICFSFGETKGVQINVSVCINEKKT